MPSTLVTTPLTPGTTEWRKAITASKVPAILGLSQYQTRADIHLGMNGILKEDTIDSVTQARFDWGHDAEDSLCKFWARYHEGVALSDGEVGYTNTDLDFPNQVLLDRVATFPDGTQTILECKTSTDYTKWGAEGDPLPADVFAQVLAQMGISGIHSAVVIAQVGSTIPRFYHLEFDSGLWADVTQELKRFFDSTNANTAPPISTDVLNEVTKATGSPTTNDAMEVPVNAISDYLSVCIEIEELIKQKEKLEEEALIPLMGNHRQLKVDGYVVASASTRFTKKTVEVLFADQLKDDRIYENVPQKRLQPELVKKIYPEMYEAGCTPKVAFKPASLVKKYANL